MNGYIGNYGWLCKGKEVSVAARDTESSADGRGHQSV